MAMNFRNLWQTYVVLFVAMLCSAMLQPIYTLLFFGERQTFFAPSAALHSQSFWFGVTMMLVQFSGIVASLCVSSLSDHIGRKNGLVISIFGLLLFALVASYAIAMGWMWLFLAGVISAYMLIAIQPVATAAILDGATAGNKVFQVGLVQFFIGLAYMAGPSLGGMLAHVRVGLSGYLLPFIVVGALSLALLTGVMSRYTAPLRQEVVAQKRITFAAFKDLFASRIMQALTLLLVLDQVAWGTYYQFLPVIAKVQFKLSAGALGMLVGMVGVWLVVSTLIIIPVLHRFFSKKGIYVAGALLFVAGMLLVYAATLWHCELLLWLSMMPVVCGDVVLFSMLTVLFSNNTPAHYQGFIVGFMYTVSMGLAWGCSALAGGLLTGLFVNGALYLSMLATAIMVVVSMHQGVRRILERG